MKSENVVLLPPEELFGAMCQMLQEGYDAQFVVSGNSMWPFLAHGRDSVIVRKKSDCLLRKGDIVFMQTENGYLLHRITSLKKNMIQTTGDHNCYRDECVSVDCVLGKVVSFVRKGKEISCTNPVYIINSKLWMAFYPIRPFLLRFWAFLKRSKL